MNRHSVSTYTESIESLSLEIFKTYSNQNSLLDLGWNRTYAMESE